MGFSSNGGPKGTCLARRSLYAWEFSEDDIAALEASPADGVVAEFDHEFQARTQGF